MKKYLALFLAVLMLVAAFAGCSEKEEKANGWFRDYMRTAASILNPHVSSSEYDSNIYGKTTMGFFTSWLVEGENIYQDACALAADWPEKMDAEGKVWQLKVRKGLKWENGDPINADTVIYSWKMLLDPKLANAQATGLTSPSYFDVVNAYEYNTGACAWEDVGIKKIDDYTVEVTSKVAATQDQVIDKFGGGSLGLVHPGKYEAGMSADRTTTNYGTTLDTYLSCGPFILTEWIPDAKYTLARNPDYPNADKIHLEGYIYNVIPDEQTALELFLQGELDKVNIASSLFEDYEEDPRVHEFYDDSLMYIFVNMGNLEQNNLLGKLNFRKALYYGLDRVTIAKTLYAYPVSRYVRNSVVGDPQTGVRFIDMPGSKDYIDDPYDIYKPDLAKEYLSKALEETGLKDCHFEFIYPDSSNAASRGRNEMIQKQFADLFEGKLEIRLRSIAGSTTALRRYNPEDPNAFEGAIGSLYPSASDPTAGFKYFISSYSPPRFCYSNPEFDALYERSISAEASADNNLKISLCQQMEKIIIDDLAIVPFYEIPNRVLISERVQLPVTEYVVGYGGIAGGFGYTQCRITDK